MKTLFQLILISAVLIILIDISSCTQSKHNANDRRYEGQLIDINTRQPIKNVAVRMTDEKGSIAQIVRSDANGNFQFAIQEPENHDYSLYINVDEFQIVNPNVRLQTNENQTWYLVPSGQP
ncbi:MAG: hypothetical protein GC180_09150 [Bacteroidetes bacterium]|nr:hypothetical protein [Bacteroidota bacterium]